MYNQADMQPVGFQNQNMLDPAKHLILLLPLGIL